MTGAKIWVNGRRRALIPAADRGLQYGDGLFETMHVREGRIRLLEFHRERLSSGLKRLGIRANFPARELQRIARDAGEGVLKLIVTRGAGARGYRPTGQERATRIVSLHPLPPSEAAATLIRLCRIRLGHNEQLAGLKSLNRLESVLARSEWSDPSIGEGLLMDQAGNLISGTMSNLFVRHRRRLSTPALEQCGVEGVMRRWVLATAPRLKFKVQVRNLNLEDLATAEEVFMSNAIVGLRSVRALRHAGRVIKFASDAAASQLRSCLEAL